MVVSGIAKNALCPCGSGEKYKRCCLSSGRYELAEGARDEEIAAVAAARLFADMEGLSHELCKYMRQLWAQRPIDLAIRDVYEHLGVESEDQESGEEPGHVHGPDCAHGHVHGPGCSQNHAEKLIFSLTPSARLFHTFLSYLLFTRVWQSGVDLERFPVDEGTLGQAVLVSRKPRLSKRYRDILRAVEGSHFSFLQIMAVQGPDLVQVRDVMTAAEHGQVHVGNPGKISEVGGLIFGRIVTVDGVSVCCGLAPVVFGDVLLSRLDSLKAKLIESRGGLAQELNADLSGAPPNSLTALEVHYAAPVLCQALVSLLEPSHL